MNDLKPKIKIEESVKEKQEFRFLGSAKYRKGMRLFQLVDSEIVEVEIEDKKVLDLTDGNAHKKAVIDPNAPVVWAINKSNAERKFKQLNHE